jgi:hypothetical protein
MSFLATGRGCLTGQFCIIVNAFFSPWNSISMTLSCVTPQNHVGKGGEGQQRQRK